MNIKFSKPKPFESKDLNYLAAYVGCDLPDDLINFFRDFNGSKPETNIFSVCDDNDSGVNYFIPLSDVVDESKYIGVVERNIIPIAVAEGGNYVVVACQENFSIFFWDHEKKDELIFLANGIYDFLSTLNPFDPDSVELKDGQVESAWIDPDFLKSLKEK
jgi:hypothetical protein